MEIYQKLFALGLRRGLLNIMERNVKAIRKRKLRKESQDVQVEDARGSKQRKSSVDKDKPLSRDKTEGKEARKNEEEEIVRLNSKSILALDHDQQGSCLLFMKKNQAIAVQGKVSIKLLQGAVDVMGHKMKTGQQNCLFSPNFSSLLTIKECSSTESNLITKSTIKDLIDFPSQQINKKAMARAQKVSSVLLLTKTDTTETNFVSQFKEYEDCFSPLKDSNGDGILNKEEKQVFEVTSPLGFMLVEAGSDKFSIYKEPEKWISFMNNITKSSRTSSMESGFQNRCILVCGGKGVGKSSFARYVINNLLNSCSEVCYLECDVGQTELTPPAILSLNCVTTPLLGPPFTHLKWPERTHFFGDVSPKDNPNLYINSISALYQYYQEQYAHKNVPLVVNTQGWVKGMGIQLLLDVIRITRPSHIIQINSSTPTKNLPTITSEFLDTYPGWVYPTSMEVKDQNKKILLEDLVENLRSEGKDSNLNATAHLLSPDTQQSLYQPTIMTLTSCSDVDQSTETKLKASDYRVMDLLAYFSRTQNSGANFGQPRPCKSLMDCKPYKISWDHVAVHVMHTEVPRSQILISLNASVVGLAVSPTSAIIEAYDNRSDLPKFLKDTPIIACVGLGIVRNIDPVNKLFYILTPVPLDELHRVNTLLKGSLEIPTTLLLKEGRPGAPYVSSEFSYDIKGAGARKVRYNLQRKQLSSPARPKT